MSDLGYWLASAAFAFVIGIVSGLFIVDPLWPDLAKRGYIISHGRVYYITAGPTVDEAVKKQ